MIIFVHLTKIKTLKEIAKIVSQARKSGKKVGLICGCFDIVHVDHIQLFSRGKRKVDMLIVALESDSSITKSKGKGRPIHNIKQRQQVIAELRSIDYVYTIEASNSFISNRANDVYINYLKEIRPHYLITNPQVDKYWKEKEKDSKIIKAKLLKLNNKKSSSSSKIVSILNSEF